MKNKPKINQKPFILEMELPLKRIKMPSLYNKVEINKKINTTKMFKNYNKK